MARRATPLWERTFGRFLKTLHTHDLAPLRVKYDAAIAIADDVTLIHNMKRRRELLDAETERRGQHLGQ